MTSLVLAAVTCGTLLALFDQSRQISSKTVVASSTNQTLQLSNQQTASLQTSLQATTDTPSAITKANEAKVSKSLKLPVSSSTADRPNRTVACNARRHQAADGAQRSALDSETRYHQDQLFIIETTGVVTRILNPNLYAHEIDRENNRHLAKLAAIEATHQAALLAAGC